MNRKVDKFFTKVGREDIMKEGQKFMTGKSMFLFSNESAFRRWCYNIVNSQLFEYLVILAIVVSSVQLALENPLEDPESLFMTVLFWVDMVMTAIFCAEMMLKIVAYGFLLNSEDSYLRNTWNLIDFVIVVFSVSSLAMQGSQLKLFKVFRLLRILRPLRMISRNEGLRVAIQAMLYAIPNIINVTVISTLFFLIFGIIGVNYFKGRFFSCKKMTDLEEHNKWECLDTGGIWENGVYHFDNIVSAMMTLFHMSTTAGWEIVMYRGAAR